jgi:V8-like Glu-specific endopeptidase
MALLTALLSFFGCAARSDGEALDQSGKDILGGIPAKSTKYDAVGLLYGVRSTGAAPLCSGSLIGPHTVLTAAHCVRPDGAPFNLIDHFPFYFAIGFDSAHPTRTIRAVAASITPTAGNDVGIYQLAEDVNDVTPVVPATHSLDATSIGHKFAVIGYGLQNSTEHYTDLVGVEPFRAVGP